MLLPCTYLLAEMISFQHWILPSLSPWLDFCCSHSGLWKRWVGRKVLELWAYSPLITWRRQLITSRAKAIGALRSGTTPQKRCFLEPVEGGACHSSGVRGQLVLEKKRIRSRETAGLHDNHVYEAQRVMVVRNGWKATRGPDEKTALKKRNEWDFLLKHFCFSRLYFDFI